MVEKKKTTKKPSIKQKQKQSQKQVVNLVVNNNEAKKKVKRKRNTNKPVVRMNGVPSQDMIYRQNQINTEFNPPNILQNLPLSGNQLIDEMKKHINTLNNPLPTPPYQTTVAAQQELVRTANGINNQIQMENKIQKTQQEEINQADRIRNMYLKRMKKTTPENNISSSVSSQDSELAGEPIKKKRIYIRKNGVPFVPSERQVTGLTKSGKIDKRTIKGRLQFSELL